MEEKREQFIAAEIRSLKVEIEAAGLTVETSETEENLLVSAFCGPDAVYESSLGDGTLHIRLGYRFPHRLFHVNTDSSQLKILLPPGLRLDNFALEIGAGNADLRRAAIKCHSFYLETGTGNARIGRLDVKKTLETKVGAGKVKLDRIKADDAKIDCGVGDFYMNGSIGHDLNVDCGIGKCTILLAGKQSDYSYDISCGIGRVSINGQTAGQIGSRYIENGNARTQHSKNPDMDHPQEGPQNEDFTKQAAGKITISCGVGNVTVKTTE